MDWSMLEKTGVEIKELVRLSDVTTFRLGGPCPWMATCQTAEQLAVTVRELAKAGLEFVLIGGGSNLLVSDSGLDCGVVRYYNERPAILRHGEFELEVAGSALLDDLAQYTVANGLEGLVYTSGIPGTVGGAIAGNAGAFGKQIGDRVVRVLLMDRSGRQRWEEPANLGFAYRASRLQDSREIVVSAHLKLERGSREALHAQRDEVLNLRRLKHPDWRKQPTAGSFFKNIEPTSAAERRQAAGWFLEQAGAKSMKVGGARVFDKHANIIVASEGCKAQDVLDLSMAMAAAVKGMYGMVLTPEVRVVGRFCEKTT